MPRLIGKQRRYKLAEKGAAVPLLEMALSINKLYYLTIGRII
jgi:hypothetical protein